MVANKLNIPVPEAWNVEFGDFFAFLALHNTEMEYQNNYQNIINRK